MALGCSSATDEHTSETDQPFATGLSGEAVHESATTQGLDFLETEIVAQLAAFNVLADVEHFFESAYHFDDCNFSGASRTLVGEQNKAVQYLNPADASTESETLALRAFGASLHIAQDFYAHSNWVELGVSGLLNTDLEAWPTLTGYSVLQPSGVMVIEGTPPRGIALYRNHTASYPANAVVIARMRSQKRLGLISGSVDYEPGDACPAQVEMSHDDLNKDRSTDADRVAQHQAALSLAVDQTGHEWCRLLSMVRTAWGDAGDQRLFEWVEDEAAASACGDPADLSIDLGEPVPSSVLVGAAVTLSVSYANSGPATAYGTAVVIDVGPSLTTISSNLGSCTAGADGRIDCYIGEIAAAASGSIEISGLASAVGSHSISASISAHVSDPNLANGSDVTTLTVSE
jgi:hypothetical protein